MSAKPVKVDFRIKLLSGNSVVMVEAGGYEPEIFVPIIVNGRISFQNIVKNRRCCISYKSNISSRCEQNLRDNEQKYLPPSNILSNQNARLNAGLGTCLGPLAYSTPTGTAPNAALKTPKSMQRSSFVSISPNFSATPEMARRDMRSIHNVAQNTLVQIPSGIKVIRLYRNPTPTIPQTKNVLRIVGSNNDSTRLRFHSDDLTALPPSPTSEQTAQVVANTLEDSDLNLPDTPDLKERRSNRRTTNPSPKIWSATKWRKCITPIRTYARREINNSASRIRNHVTPSVRLSSDVCPSYMLNPTQTAKSSLQVEVKKRKLTIDPKVKITPRSFKKQQLDTSDLTNNSKYRLPRTRKEYEAKKLSAFQMLTNSNRVRHMSPKLNSQFRKGCVNKASSTNPRYKQLCSIPPLQQDSQTNDFQRNGGMFPTTKACRNQNTVANSKIPYPIS